MLNKKSWEEFQKSGLLFFVNQILHFFGWCIVFSFDENQLIEVYPARTRFRGFCKETMDKGYFNVTKYLKDNVDELWAEVQDEAEEAPKRYPDPGWTVASEKEEK